MRAEAAASLRAPAKLNLELRVTGRLPDGRHALDSIFQVIDVCDQLILERRPGQPLEVEVAGFPVEGPNLVQRAAQLLGLDGLRVRLEKRIPVGSGLGGGSSDAAALLRAYSAPDAASMARQLGADVEFFLRGGRQRVRGAGDVLEPLPFQAGWFAVAWPGFGVSTAAVYRAYDRVGGDGRNHLTRAAFSVEPRLRAFAAGLGEGWTMTGSGSAFFYSATSEAEAEAALGSVRSAPAWSAVASALPAFG